MSEEAFFFKYARSVHIARDDPWEFLYTYGKFYLTTQISSINPYILILEIMMVNVILLRNNSYL